MGIFAPGAIKIRTDQDPIPVLANVYENKSDPVHIAGDSTNHVVIGPQRVEVDEVVGLRLSSPDTNLGTATNIVIGGTAPPNTGLRHGLMRCDLTSLVGKEILSATLMLHSPDFTNSTSPGTTGPLQVHAVLVANDDWTETGSTWNEIDAAGNVNWAGTAGLSTSGTDYNATPMGSKVYNQYNGSTLVPYWLDIELDVSDFQDMVAANYGWLLRLQTEGQALGSQVVIDSDDAADPSVRPYLLVTVKPEELGDVDMALVTEIHMQAQGGDEAWYANTLDASVSERFVLPRNQMVIEKVNTNGEPSLSIYAETGTDVVYKFRGPIE